MPLTSPVANPSVGVGLGGVNDSSTQQPFLDVFKTAREWAGHIEGQYGGITLQDLRAAGLLDANGYPTEIPDTMTIGGREVSVTHIGTVILTDLPADMTSAAGRYRLTYEGDGEIRLLGASNVVQGDGEIWFDYTPNGRTGVFVEIVETGTNGNNIHDISVVHERNIERFEAGEIFNPQWLDLISDMRSLRFMDWMQTNNSDAGNWEARTTTDHYSWGSSFGVPVEVMVELANLVGSDPWFNIPHLADEAYIRAFAEYVRDNLDPDLKAHFEYSNEVWNWQFDQAQWAHEMGQERWPGEGAAWIEWQAMKAVEMARIVDEVFGDQADDRVVKVISTQTGWQGLEDPLLEAPHWVAEDPANNAAPATYFDAYAVTGYFDGALGRDEKAATTLQWIAQSRQAAETAAARLGLTGQDRANYIEAHKFDQALDKAIAEMRDGSVTGNPEGSLAQLAETFAYHAAIAERYGLQLVMYEGGTHLVGVGSWSGNATLTEFFQFVNQSPEMGALYAELLDIWRDAGGTMFNAFVDVSPHGWWGSWGALQHLDDLESWRWDALSDFNAENPGWWETRDPDAFIGVLETNYPPFHQGEGNPEWIRLLGTTGDDLIEAGKDAQLIIARAGADTVWAGGGDDFIADNDPDGSSGMLRGGFGNDTILAGDGDDKLIGGRGDDVLVASGGDDTLIGRDGADDLNGGAGNDLIWGGLDNDTLTGGTDNDTLNGGEGDDILIGGAGADVFIFSETFGQDRVADFDVSRDVVDMRKWGFSSLDELAAHLADTEDGVLFRMGDATLLLEDITLAQLSDSNWMI